MSAKDATGTKKEKSFNGSKAKYSPNPPVPDKKEVKLRRKESEKVKQTNDSTRKSVLGRFFHNLVDSDDSRKKSASADTKKKRTGRDQESSGIDLDLPEHGLMLRRTQTLQRTQEAIPSAQIRAATLSNQGHGRENRNRWSSYDIHGTNFMVEGALPGLQLDSATLGHRSQSDETLNTPLVADQNASKFAENFEIVSHSDAKRQPDTMRKHAQMLKTIQENRASRTFRAEKSGDSRGSRNTDMWLSSGDTVANGQRKNTDSTGFKDTDQKSDDSKIASSSVEAKANASKKTGSENSASLALLHEKSKEIDKALAEKRRVLSNLFKTSEEDLERLTAKDVELSKDLTVQKMILISLLQSDRLTSVINSSLVPRKTASPDGGVDKGASNHKDNESQDEQKTDNSLNVQSLQSTAVRLYQHMKLLTEMVNQEVGENDRLKKKLEETKDCIKKKNIEKIKQTETFNNQQKVTNTSSELNISTESRDLDAEESRKELDLKLDVKESFVVDESVEVEIKSENASVNQEILDNSKDTADVEQLLTSREDLERDKEPLNSVVESVPCFETHSGTDICIQKDNDVELENAINNLEIECTNLPSAKQEATLSVAETDIIGDIGIPVEKAVDSDFKFQQNSGTDSDSFCNSVVKIHDEEAADAKQPDDIGSSRNLDSIPEDDDKLSICDAESKVVFSDDSNERISVSAVQISAEHSSDEDSVLSLDVEVDDKILEVVDDNLSDTKNDVLSEVSNISRSNVEADASLNCRNDDHLQSNVDAEDLSTSETGDQSSANSLEYYTDSDFDAVLPESQMVKNQDGDILDNAFSQLKPVEEKSENHLDEQTALLDATNDVDLLDLSIELPGIPTDKEEEESEKTPKHEILDANRCTDDEEVEEDSNSESDDSSESELKHEVKKEAADLENAEKDSNSESDDNSESELKYEVEKEAEDLENAEENSISENDNNSESELKCKVEKEAAHVENAEEDSGSENDDSESELKCEVEKEAAHVENVKSLPNAELDENTEPSLLVDIEWNVESDGENISKHGAITDDELHQTVISGDEMTKTGFPSADLLIENSNLNIIPENKEQTQLNKDSLSVDIPEDQNGNQEVEKSTKFLGNDQKEDHSEKETVIIAGSDSNGGIDKISDLSTCDSIEVDILKE